MANPYFNAQYYLTQNPDLLAAGINTVEAAWAHYVNYGAAEALNGVSSRSPAPWFDVKYYLSVNPDLVTSGLTGAQLFEHFVKYGIDEGRVPSAAAAQMTDASLLAYAKGNADLATAFGVAADATSLTDAQRDGLANHFYEYGYKEGRADAPFTPDNNPGETFTLTTGADNFVGTAGNDTINAGLTGAGATIQPIDSIDGGAGIDTLNTTANTNGDILGGALVKNVENINVRVTSGTAATLDASSAAGLTNINANLGAGTLVATNLAKGAAVSVTGDGNVANGEVAFTYATATDAVTLNVAGGTKMTAGITAHNALGGGATGTATTATINSTGAANVVGTVDLANATLTSVTFNAATNLKGDFLSQATNQVGTDGAVTIAGAAASVEFTAALDDTIKSIDASGLTAGGLTATLGTGITSLKGGQGNDVITTAATTAAGAVIDAGAGTADKLVLAATNDVSTAAKGAQYTNFEILGLNNSQDVSLISGITALELNAMTSKTISKISAAQAAAITVTGDQTTALTLTLADATGSADKVALNLKSATATSNVDVAGLSIAGVETLDVAATTGSAGSSSDISFAASGADKLTAINVSGAANSSFAGGNTSKAITLNSTATGNVTLTGNWVTGSSFTLGGGKDTITLGSGFNTYNSGAGDDTFNATAAQLNTGADYNVINGGEGTDTLNITDGAAAAINIVDNNLSKVSGIEKIVISSTTTGNQSIQTGGWFDAAFKAAGVDLTTTTTTGTIGIDMTSFSGAATLTTTSTDGNQTIQTGTTGGNDKVTAVAGKGNVTVSTGAGDDVVSVTTVGTGAGEGAITITTGAGNDTITIVNAAAGDGATITPGAGADKITLGTDTAKVVIGNTDSGITVATADSITGFVSGTHTIALGFNGGATNATEAAAAVADFSTALTNANAALAALKVANPAVTEFANFQWDATNGYLFNDTNADGTADQVIVLVGITGTTFAVNDIVA